MSYMVEILLLEQDRIIAEGDIESDQLNDLALVQLKLDELRISNKFSTKYWLIFDAVMTSGTFKDAGKKLGISRRVLIKKFTEICDEIGKNLGGIYTDRGLINFMVEKYKLNSEETLQLMKFLKRRFQYYKQL